MIRQDVHEIRLVPKKTVKVPVEWIVVRIVGQSIDDALTYLERNFIDFDAEHIFSGYRNVEDT